MPVAFGLVRAKKVPSTQVANNPASGDLDDDDGIIPLSQVGVPRCAACRQKLQVKEMLNFCKTL